MRLSVRAALAVLALAIVSAGVQIRRNADSQSFPTPDGGRLNVRLPGGDIRVEVWSNPEILVRTVDLGSRIKAEQRGREVVVRSGGEHSHWHSGRVDAKVPVRCDLDLSTSSGYIEVRGDIRGDAWLTTSSGDISLGGVTGAVVANTAGGDIDVGDVSGEVDLRTAGGDVFTGNLGGRAKVNSAGGDLRLGDVSGRLEAWTSGGEVIAGRLGADAELGTAGGDVRVQAVNGRASLRTSGGDIEVDGPSRSIVARTAGGDIRLRQVTGTVEARSSGGDVEIHLIPGGEGGSTVETQSGDIDLSLPPGTSATIEAVIHVQGHWSSQDEYRIHSDFPGLQPRYDPRRKEVRATLTLNGGGQPIFLETTNGDIRILDRKVVLKFNDR